MQGWSVQRTLFPTLGFSGIVSIKVSNKPEARPAATRSATGQALLPARRPLSERQVCAICDRLSAPRAEGRNLFLRNSRRAARPQVVLELVQRSFGLRKSEPQRALQIGRLALRLSRRLGPERPGAAEVACAQGEAIANLANLLRLREKYRSAAVLLSVAEAVCGGVADSSLRARLMEYRALLLRAQGHLKEAAEELSRAAALYQSIADPLRLARALVSLAIVQRRAGDARAALTTLHSVCRQFDEQADVDLGLVTLHNLVLCLEDLGDHAQALQELGRAEAFYRKLAAPAYQLPGWWLKGRLLSRAGALPEAAQYLEATRQAFLERRLPYDASLAALDLALVYAKQRRPHLVYKLASEMHAVFTAKGIPHQAAAALAAFGHAAEHWRADAKLIEQLLAGLAPARRASGR